MIWVLVIWSSSSLNACLVDCWSVWWFAFFLYCCGRPIDLPHAILSPVSWMLQKGRCVWGACQQPEIWPTTIFYSPRCNQGADRIWSQVLTIQKHKFPIAGLKDNEEQYNTTNLARVIHTAGWLPLRAQEIISTCNSIWSHQWGYDTWSNLALTEIKLRAHLNLTYAKLLTSSA